jgi:hypothetical protein
MGNAPMSARSVYPATGRARISNPAHRHPVPPTLPLPATWRCLLAKDSSTKAWPKSLCLLTFGGVWPKIMSGFDRTERWPGQ